MALYPNSRYMSQSPGRHFGVAPGLDVYLRGRGDSRNRFVSDTYSQTLGAVPSGYGPNAWIMATKAGGIAGFSSMAVSPSGAGVLGVPGSGSTDFTISIADATGQLISSGSGTASLSFTWANALLVASLGGSGNAALSIAPNTPTLGAKASLTANGTFSITATNSQVLPLDTTSPLRTGGASFAVTGQLTPYAIGTMNGSTVDNSVLTVDAITAALIAAAMTTPIHANIKRVNDYAVSGNGQTGSEWGPA